MFLVESVLQGYHEYKDNWPEGSFLLLLQLGDEDISRLTSLHPSLHLRSLLMHVQTFYPEVESFTKNGDKFGWVKY